jgi:hypothetical protein
VAGNGRAAPGVSPAVSTRPASPARQPAPPTQTLQPPGYRPLQPATPSLAPPVPLRLTSVSPQVTGNLAREAGLTLAPR